MTTPDEPDWRLLAACRHHDPELFFPDPSDVGTREAAMRICRGCPVMARCKVEKKRIRASYGVWAGEFIDKLVTQRPPRDVHPCGTPAAYKRHHRKNEKPCRMCMDAHDRDRVDKYRKSVERRANR